MILKIRSSFLAIILGFGLLGVGCTDDDKKAEETVQPAQTETPATPPEDTMSQGNGGAPSNPVYFQFDDYTLDNSSQETLRGLAAFMKSKSSVVVQIEGHCDERGSIEYNLALGERRANSVKNFLVQLGVDAARLPTISYGEEKPAVEGHDEAAWVKNRRAEFVISNP